MTGLGLLPEHVLISPPAPNGRGRRQVLPSSGHHEADAAVPYGVRSKISGSGTPPVALPVIGGFGSELSPGSTTNL